MDILIEIGRTLLYILWIWSISPILSKVRYFHKKDNLSLQISNIDNIKTCQRYCDHGFLSNGLDGYNAYLEIEPLFKKYPNIGIYFSKKTVVLKDAIMIKDIENYKNSKKTINKFNL